LEILWAQPLSLSPSPFTSLFMVYSLTARRLASLVSADKGMLLKLDFRDEFKLEDSPDCRFDFLEVRDGQYGYSNLLGNFCGTNFPPEITSKTRYLWLRFHSDENIEGKGFKAVWSTIPRPTYRKFPSQIFEFFFPNFLIFFSEAIFIKM